MTDTYTPTPEAVSRIQAEIYAAGPEFRPISSELARFILTRQHAREAGLLEALRYYLCQPGSTTAARALAAHAALDAAPEPTLLDLAERVTKSGDLSALNEAMKELRERVRAERAK